ncbi:hypothetical protein B0T24DRAFT_406425 [Lasiosphaeria ovina]|uniref:Uncharacterized protein n=1 Tax=Lasiosphaeria ovina TaxID=92902 RepID=A0AAE0JX19_9PEZI|nr:hypothetical protein B0T24DRAFT_406425 [Lasiosphaeria ovina]
MSSYLEAFSKWLKLKIYQLEVTLSVYIFTPIEKFIFYSVLFLIVSLTFIATVLYLPQHVQFVLSRAWFYMNGDAPQESVVQHVVAKSAAVVTDTIAAAAAAAAATGGVVREL